MVLERFKYFFHWEETFFWVNLRQLGIAVLEFWALVSLMLIVTNTGQGVSCECCSPSVVFLWTKWCIQSLAAPKGVIPFSQLHLHLCELSLVCVLTLSPWEDEQVWVWDFLLAFVKILLSMSWVFFNGHFVYGLIVAFFPMWLFLRSFFLTFKAFLKKPFVGVSRFHCSSGTALWLPTLCTVLTKNPLSCCISPISF